MKYIITYTAKRKNARRHVYSSYGKPQYFNSIEEAKAHPMYEHPLYEIKILTANYKEIEE